jgi:hypothetical protein
MVCGRDFDKKVIEIGVLMKGFLNRNLVRAFE